MTESVGTGGCARIRQVAFGYHPDWSPTIGRRLDPARYQVSIAPLDAIDLARFDAVLPLHTSHYAELGRCAPAARRNFIIPDPVVVELCDDKPALAARLCDLGYARHVPEVYNGPVRTPYIVKPRRGEYGRECRIILDPAEPPPPSDPAFFFQELVVGPEEFALHILRHDARIRYARAVKYKMAGPARVHSATGRPVQTSFTDCADVLDLFNDILEALDYSGTCCINYKLREGRPMIMEINPRFGGSLTTDIARYVDAYVEALGH